MGLLRVLLLLLLYSVSPFINGLEDDFASCGEDGTLRVWRGKYDVISCNDDVILHY